MLATEVLFFGDEVTSRLSESERRLERLLVLDGGSGFVMMGTMRVGDRRDLGEVGELL